MQCCISKGFFKQWKQWLMINDYMSFLTKVKCLRCTLHLKALFQWLNIMSQHLKVICLNKQQVLDTLKFFHLFFQRSLKYLHQWHSCPWVGEEYSLNPPLRHHIQSVKDVKHHRTSKDNHLKLHSWSFQMLQCDCLTKWNQYYFFTNGINGVLGLDSSGTKWDKKLTNSRKLWSSFTLNSIGQSLMALTLLGSGLFLQLIYVVQKRVIQISLTWSYSDWVSNQLPNISPGKLSYYCHSPVGWIQRPKYHQWCWPHLWDLATFPLKQIQTNHLS